MCDKTLKNYLEFWSDKNIFRSKKSSWELWLFNYKVPIRFLEYYSLVFDNIILLFKILWVIILRVMFRKILLLSWFQKIFHLSFINHCVARKLLKHKLIEKLWKKSSFQFETTFDGEGATFLKWLVIIIVFSSYENE